jgi:hypothetical protein
VKVAKSGNLGGAKAKTPAFWAGDSARYRAVYRETVGESVEPVLRPTCPRFLRFTDDNVLTIWLRVSPRFFLLRGRRGQSKESLRKEVIQPQVLLRLPCYDLLPVTDLAVVADEIQQLRALPASMS